MDPIPFSRSRSQSLVYAAVVDALTQRGWQPPAANLSYNAQLTGFQLKSLSPSSLTVPQEDLATLHGSPFEQSLLDPGYGNTRVIDNVDHTSVLHHAVTAFPNRPNTQHAQQQEDATALEIIDLCSSPDPSRSSSADESHPRSNTPIATEGQILSSPSSLSTVNAPNSTRAKVANHTTTEASNITSTLGKALSQHTFKVSREARNSLQTNTAAAHNNRKRYRALAKAPPLSDVRVTYKPSRPLGRLVAADFFTPHSSPEPGEIRAEPARYSTKDIEDLIGEEKAKALRAHQARRAEPIGSTLRQPQDTCANTIGPKRATSGILPPNESLKDGDGRNVKRAKHIAGPEDRSYLQYTVSGLS
ncbi:MAG: hypothetical protein Q9181_002757 [Wetmoreana brouardii]